MVARNHDFEMGWEAKDKIRYTIFCTMFFSANIAAGLAIKVIRQDFWQKLQSLSQTMLAALPMTLYSIQG